MGKQGRKQGKLRLKGTLGTECKDLCRTCSSGETLPCGQQRPIKGFQQQTATHKTVESEEGRGQKQDQPESYRQSRDRKESPGGSSRGMAREEQIPQKLLN